MRKVDVQPAPRMRMWTDEGGEVVGGEGVVGVVSCVIVRGVEDQLEIGVGWCYCRFFYGD